MCEGLKLKVSSLLQVKHGILYSTAYFEATMFIVLFYTVIYK